VKGAFGNSMNYSVEELEAIGLCIALEAVNDIVNHELLKVRYIQDSESEAEIYFPTRIHQNMFLIRLLDFVKEEGNAALTEVRGSCLAVLQAAYNTRSFDVNDSVSALRESTIALANWFDAARPLTLWLPTLETNAKLNVARHEFLYISANQAKHNISRLTGLSKRIAHLLNQNGYDVSIEQIPLALDDFQEHLTEDYFFYYGTWLSELMNNVRWGIQKYLVPTYEASLTQDPCGGIKYTYRYPSSITNTVPRLWFFRLMNNIRRGPCLKPFEASRYTKREMLRSEDS
jgi:hypothetical protein